MTDEEIVKALAEKVMGWESKIVITHQMGEFISRNLSWAIGDTYAAPSDWSPLTNDIDSMAVLDKMVENGWWIDLSWNGHAKLWGCEIDNLQPGSDLDYHEDPARRRTVAIAALKAVGAFTELDPQSPRSAPEASS